jgi:hypothetical protein
MTDDDDDDDRVRVKTPSKRVTLSLNRASLGLPGEQPRRRRRSDPLPPLDLPDLDSLDRSPSIPPPANVPMDAWSADRAGAEPKTPGPAEVSPPDDGGEGGALALVEKRSRKSSPALDYSAEMADRYALGDYTTALELAQLILGRDPEHDAAKRIRAGSRDRLIQLYGTRLGDLGQVPVIRVATQEIRWLGLDNRAAFLLSRIDGTSNLADIVHVSGMDRLDALKTLVELTQMGAIRLVPPP